MFRIDRKALQAELSLLTAIAGQKNVIPALSTIRFEVRDGNASLLASNSELSLFTDIPAEGENWQGCIPAKQLYDLVRLWNGDTVTFTPQGNQIQMSWSRTRHRLPAAGFYSFPDVTVPAVEKDRLTVKWAQLRDSLERVIPCVLADRDSSKWNMKGVKFEAKDGQLNLVGTNQHRLGVATIPAEGELDVVVPTQAANLVSRLEGEEVAIWRSENQIVFNVWPRTLVSRLPIGEFPNWRMIMPKELPLSVTVDTKEWAGALRRADVTRESTFQIGAGRVLLGVVLVLAKDELTIDTKVTVEGRSEEAISIQSNLNGEKIYVGINPDYVMDFLRLAGEKTEIALEDADHMLRLSDGSGFQYLVFPLSLREKKRQPLIEKE